MSETPEILYAEAFVGWRGWGVHNGRLTSVNDPDVIWEPGDEMHAECDKGKRHQTPFMNCSCGFYATKTLEQLRDNHYHLVGVFGQVNCWGRVIDHTGGYRAQICYPKIIYVPFLSMRLIEPLSVYGVPVKLLNPYTGQPEDNLNGNR